MPSESAPTNPTEPTTPSTTLPSDSGVSSFVFKALGCGCAPVVVLVLVVLIASGSWGPSDFPRIAPEEMANRAFERSQEAYDVVGFKRTVKPGVEDVGVSTENTLGSSFCHGGLTGLEDKTVDGAYQMSHRWALDHVPARQAVSGLHRLHQHLKDKGWEITSYSEGEHGNWDLFAKRDDGAERMSFSWYPDREYFTGGASVPCAYDPAWKEGDIGPSGDNRTPPTLGPRSGT